MSNRGDPRRGIFRPGPFRGQLQGRARFWCWLRVLQIVVTRSFPRVRPSLFSWTEIRLHGMTQIKLGTILLPNLRQSNWISTAVGSRLIVVYRGMPMCSRSMRVAVRSTLTIPGSVVWRRHEDLPDRPLVTTSPLGLRERAGKIDGSPSLCGDGSDPSSAKDP